MPVECHISCVNRSNDKVYTLYIIVSVKARTLTQGAGFDTTISILDLLGIPPNLCSLAENHNS
jgi:hypothetical protein